jgi:hypothetical protein
MKHTTQILWPIVISLLLVCDFFTTAHGREKIIPQLKKQPSYTEMLMEIREKMEKGKFQDMGPKLNDCLRETIRLTGAQSQTVAEVRKLQAAFFYEKAEYNKAESAFIDVLRTQQLEYGETSIEWINHALQLANFYSLINEKKKSLQLCQKISKNVEKLPLVMTEAKKEMQNQISVLTHGHHKQEEETISDTPATTPSSEKFSYISGKGIYYHRNDCPKLTPENFTGKTKEVLLLDARFGGFIPCSTCRPTR